MINCVRVILFVNLTIIVGITFSAVRRKLYLKGLKKKHKIRMKEYEERRLLKELQRAADSKNKIEL